MENITDIWLHPVDFGHYQGGFSCDGVIYATKLHIRQYECRAELDRMIQDRRERLELLALARAARC